MTNRDTIISLCIFFLILMLVSLGGYTLTLMHNTGSTPLMWSVGIASIITCLIRKRSLSSLGFSFGSWKYQWLSYAIPLSYIFVSYIIIWVFGLGGWFNVEYVVELQNKYALHGLSNTQIIVFAFLFFASFGFLNSFIACLGEEIGWRGFLTPELAKFMSFGWVAVVSGTLWSLWHWPLIFMGVLGNKGTSLAYQLLFFTILLISMSVIMAYIRLKTGSTLTAAVFHTSHNIFIQKVFTPLTIQNADTSLYIDENGAVPALVTCVFAIYFWKKGIHLTSTKKHNKGIKFTADGTQSNN